MEVIKSRKNNLHSENKMEASFHTLKSKYSSVYCCRNEPGKELEQWGKWDAKRQTQWRRDLPKAAGIFDFETVNSLSKDCDDFRDDASLCDLQEFALIKRVMHLVSRPNSVTFFLQNINYKSATRDFKNLLGFIYTSPEPGKSELSALVFPVFVYFYLLLLLSEPSELLNAQFFFNQNKKAFSSSKSYNDILEELYSITSIYEIKEDSFFHNFLEDKYIIGLSPDVMKSLREFIKNQADDTGEMILFYVLYFHFHFEDVDEGESDEESIESNEDEDIMIKDCIKPVENEILQIDLPEATSILENLSLDEQECADDMNESVSDEILEVEDELEDLLHELNIDHPCISTIVSKYEEEDNILSMDFNDEDTEVAYLLSKNRIYIAPINTKKENKRSLEDDTVSYIVKSGKRIPYYKFYVCFDPLPSERKISTFSENSSESKMDESLEDDYPLPLSDEEETKKHVTDKCILIKYLPGKSHLLVAVFPKTVKFFDSKSKEFEAKDITVDALITDVDINSTCEYLVTANSDSTSHLYCLDDKTEVCRFFGHEKALRAVRFHPNEVYVATGSDDCTVRLFEIDTGLCVRVFVGHISAVMKIAFSPDGKLLASADYEGFVKVWDIKDCIIISEIGFSVTDEEPCKITSLCFHGDSSVVAACNMKGEMKFWSVRNSNFMKNVNFLNIPMEIKFKKQGVWKVALAKKMRKFCK